LGDRQGDGLEVPEHPQIGPRRFYAIGKIRAAMDFRKTAPGLPGNNYAQGDPIFLQITPEQGRVRMYWRDTSNGRSYYFLQCVNYSDWIRFDEWYRQCCLGPVPTDLAGKIFLVCKRGLKDYLLPAAASRFRAC
jgi:hypothetical protein